MSSYTPITPINTLTFINLPNPEEKDFVEMKEDFSPNNLSEIDTISSLLDIVDNYSIFITPEQYKLISLKYGSEIDVFHNLIIKKNKEILYSVDEAIENIHYYTYKNIEWRIREENGEGYLEYFDEYMEHMDNNSYMKFILFQSFKDKSKEEFIAQLSRLESFDKFKYWEYFSELKNIIKTDVVNLISLYDEYNDVWKSYKEEELLQLLH